MRLINIRMAVQGLFLLLFLFLFLQTESKGADELGWPVRLFLDFDPLVLATTLLSAHAASAAFYWSLAVVVLTVLFGRVFCGWACPLGTLNNMVGALGRKKTRETGLKLRRLKYYMLFFILASALFTLQPVGLMDPMSLLIRSMSISVYPLFNRAAGAVFDAAYSLGVPALSDIAGSAYSALRGRLIAFREPYFRQAVLVGAIFFAVLGLNLVERRFWCRNLCPLGALLGLLSRRSILSRSVSEGCNECGSCTALCQGGALYDGKDPWLKSECLYCMNCDDACPNNAVRFGFGPPGSGRGVDLGRRNVLASMAAGVVAVPLVRATPLVAAPNPLLIRPPGSLDEGEFLRRCVKCGECMKVCITGGLQPTLLEAGLEGLWSPVLVPRVGYCELRCTLCGQVCPTGAIRRLSPGEKSKVKIGLAMVDRGRCLPWAHSVPCIVCEEVCPTPKKAVWLEAETARDREGRTIELKRPRVDLELCIGCGICEAKCPVVDRPAIYVTSAGESRSKTNRVLF